MKTIMKHTEHSNLKNDAFLINNSEAVLFSFTDKNYLSLNLWRSYSTDFFFNLTKIGNLKIFKLRL